VTGTTIAATAPSADLATGGLGVGADVLVPDLRAPVTAAPALGVPKPSEPALPVYVPPTRPAHVAAATFGVVAAGLGIAAAFQQFEAGTIWGDAQSTGKTGDQLLFARQQAADAQDKALWLLSGALATATVSAGVWWWSREAAE
jgi:hypothetical protein